MRKLFIVLVILVLIVGAIKLVDYFKEKKGPEPGTVKDEALTVERTPESFPAADEDYFADMDYGVTRNPAAVHAALSPYVTGITPAQAVASAVKGRNNWIVWTGGNDRFWDELNSKYSYGTIDLLKTVSSYKGPGAKSTHGRHDRWEYLGVVNEPCFTEPTAGRADRFGLWLDVRDPNCPPDPFENEQKYPGVKIGSRGTTVPVGSFYGYATGVVGLRLFPNPNFDEKAKAHWNAEKYYTDPAYYNDASLVKPYRVGMTCGFCHVGPNPSNPPNDPENPAWANLNSNPGAQYFWVNRIFVYDPQQSSFPSQLFNTSRPGALDTSFVSSDNINNPRTMNAVYNLGARLEIGRKWGAETLAGGGLNNKQFNDYVQTGPLTQLWDKNTKVARVPHVLKDGADSVGAIGALNRVYINIGLFSEEWVLHFKPLIGAVHPSGIQIADMERNSSYWKATEMQSPDVALFFLAATPADLLKNAPGGAAMITADAAQLTRGKEIFAERCARCHSSKLPEKAFTDFFKPGCVGPDYLKCWNDYWQWTKTAEFKDAMKPIVMAPDFADANNALTTDLRVPVTLLETNACSPLATNGIANNIWDNFSSDSYKNLPAVGKVRVQDPYPPYKPSDYDMPAGGRGYTRPPSLASLWSTAPFLVNNSVGKFHSSPSVSERMASFNDSIGKMLWPERRDGNMTVETLSGKQHPGWIDRTDGQTFLTLAPGYVPKELHFSRLSGVLSWLLPNLVSGGEVKIGPIPSGTPINLLANIDISQPDKVGPLVYRIFKDLKKLPANATDEQARQQFAPLLPDLLGVSKCRDFVINKGHYFGTDFLPAAEGEPGLSDPDKQALIEFLKTF